MNTPSHVILNLALVQRWGADRSSGHKSALITASVVGSLLPDAALFLFYGWARFWVQAPERQIWGDLYYTDPWQDIFAIGNSIPLALAGCALCYWRRRPVWLALFASMVLHQLEDLPLHHEDAHRHFFPFSNVRFISPVSYWDADHFGTYAALGEWLLVMVASVWLWRHHANLWGRGALLAINGLYLVLYCQFYLWG